MSEKRTFRGILYSCLHCGKTITSEQMALMLEIKCPHCGYRVLRKIRSPIVKRIKAH